MGQVTPKGRPRVRGRRLIPLAGALLAFFAVLPAALADPGPGESSPRVSLDPSPSPSVEPSPFPSVSCVLSQTKVI